MPAVMWWRHGAQPCLTYFSFLFVTCFFSLPGRGTRPSHAHSRWGGGMCPLEHRHKCVSGCPSLEPLSTGKKRERCIPPERVATLPVCRQTRSPGTSAVAQAGNRYWPVASARNEEQSPGPMSAHLTFFACCKGRGRGEIAPGAANCSPPSPWQCQEAGTEPTLASPPCRFPPAKASSCFRPRLWRSCQDGVVCHGVAMERARAQGQRRPHPGGGHLAQRRGSGNCRHGRRVSWQFHQPPQRSVAASASQQPSLPRQRCHGGRRPR